MTRQHSRLLTTVLLLIGLLTMHGVSGNHGPMLMMPGTTASSATTTAEAPQAPILTSAGTEARHVFASALRGSQFVMTHPSCVAILLSSLLLLLVSMLLIVKHRRRVPSPGPPDSFPRSLRSSLDQHPPDLLAELCVSRT